VTGQQVERGPAAILAGDVAGYSRRFEEAVPRIRVATEDMPVSTSYRFLAACYAQMGLLGEARAVIARLRAITPEVMVNYPLPFRDPGHRELYLPGLRLAMGEAEWARPAATLLTVDCCAGRAPNGRRCYPHRVA
jgi:hypothetical protein